MKSLWAWVLIGCFGIENVYAADELVYESNVTINRIGAHPGNTFYVSLAEGFKNLVNMGSPIALQLSPVAKACCRLH
ncbi:hypothetical protein P4S72_26645 [Vibrio sp. PP-XX7]